MLARAMRTHAIACSTCLAAVDCCVGVHFLHGAWIIYLFDRPSWVSERMAQHVLASA